ncbi:hypothetical protein G7Y89_g2116 [Cudoniella acicularis]|uniref:NmrA-like domain-containing protein n=1 Tax=Cudoniella acicularis TaxID=354080 RepID=A0A8H4RTZ5_9HELO|nr:hypothetical protein G7Y89_g2116 [Cudoniella acicularis]
MAPQAILVAGATGFQGSAVAQRLLSSGKSVHALVRNPSKPSALALQKLGATLFQGDFDSVPSILAAAHGCDGLFILTSPTMPSASEVTHVENIISAAKTAGIKICVFSCVARAEAFETGFKEIYARNEFLTGYWRAKARIQEIVQEAGFESWTILQPAWLMTNWVAPNSVGCWGEELKKKRVLINAYAENTIVDLTDGEDIATFAWVFFDKEKGWEGMEGKLVKVASEGLTISEIAKAMTDVGGVEVGVKFREMGEIEHLRPVHPIVATQWWQRVDGTMVDFKEVKSYGLKLTPFKAFLERNKPALLEALGAEK